MGVSESLFDGVSGLSNHQTWMDVIGNNIANVNTTGFKDQQYNFADVIYQTIKGASAGVVGGAGGTDFEQIGLGSHTGSLISNQQEGSLQTTNIPTDFAIQGDGFFIVNDGQANHYTRDSNFIVDGAGNINSAATGYHLQGYGLKQVGNTVVLDTTKIVNLTVPNQTNPAQQTNVLGLVGNLQSTSTSTQTQSIGVYDSLGQLHNVVLSFTPSGKADGNWTVAATSPDLIPGSNIIVSGGNTQTTVAGDAGLHFNSLGQLDGTVTPLVLDFVGANTPTIPITGTSGLSTAPTQAALPWLIPGTQIASNASQTGVVLTLNDVKVGSLTQFASPTAVETQAVPDSSVIPNPTQPNVVLTGNLNNSVPAPGFTTMGKAFFVMQDSTGASHNVEVGLDTTDGFNYNPQVLTVDGFSGAIATPNANLQNGSNALVPVVLTGVDSTGQSHAFRVELSPNIASTGITAGSIWAGYIDQVDGLNPRVTGNLQTGLPNGSTTQFVFNKMEPDGVNHTFAVTLTWDNVTSKWTVNAGTDITVDGAPAPGYVTVTPNADVIANGVQVNIGNNGGASVYKNAAAETVTYDFSKVLTSTNASTLTPQIINPSIALKYDATGKIVSGGSLSFSINANSMFTNAGAGAVETNSAQQFNFDFAQVSNTANATAMPPVANPVGALTLPISMSAGTPLSYAGIPSSIVQGSNRNLTIAANAFANGNQAQTLTLDFSRITQSAQPGGISGPLAGTSGNAAGSLKEFNVDQTGVLHGVYTNGFTQEIGQILLATVENPGGMQREGVNNMQISANSGVVNIGVPGTGKFGTVAAGNVETSNVDLANEFSNMILAERGFQANSRIITTSDEMLQDVVNIKH
jgi:flagellar hook protein FlgE